MQSMLSPIAFALAPQLEYVVLQLLFRLPCNASLTELEPHSLDGLFLVDEILS